MFLYCLFVQVFISLAMATDLADNENRIPVADKNFQICLEEIADKYGWLTSAEFKEITCHNKSIQSVSGLYQFSQLEKLSLYNNNIKEIDLSLLPRLRYVNVAGNKLTYLQLKNIYNLTTLYAFKNKLISLDIDNVPLLSTIKANNNELINLSINNAGNLVKLNIFNNQLEIIDIKKLSSLKYLDTRQNPMSDEFYDHLDSINGLTALHDGNADDWN